MLNLTTDIGKDLHMRAMRPLIRNLTKANEEIDYNLREHGRFKE